MTPKKRLLRVLNKQAVDRPPVICPGGMMNAASVEIMTHTGNLLPEAHMDSHIMANLAADIHRLTGFENIGIPFCMTVEAEVMGSEVSYGSLSCEPKVSKEKYASFTEVICKDIPDLLCKGRVETVLNAIKESAMNYPEIPVIGNLCGPISLAASLVDPVAMLKGLRRDKDNAHRVLNYVSNVIGDFAALMIGCGASVIAISDPTATGEILGPQLFEEYAVRYINQIISTIHQRETKVIVHICGNMNRVRNLLPSIQADAISVDALVNLQKLKNDFPQMITMGNVSTYLLQDGLPDTIKKTTKRLVEEGVDIIAPACGLSTSTAISQIQTLTQAVKE